MGDFLAIVGQIFWGVTVGALGSAFSWAAKGAITAIGLGGAGWWGWKRRRKRRGDNTK